MMKACLSLDKNKRIYSVEERFLKLLSYCIQRKKYGVERDGQIWIYNTLEDWAQQLDVSARTIRRAIKSLKDQGKIKTAYLSKNKRNRTLFYTIAEKDENENKRTNGKMHMETKQGVDKFKEI